MRDKFRNNLNEQDAKFTEILAKIDEKATNNDIKNVQNLFDRYATNSQLSNLKKELIP